MLAKAIVKYAKISPRKIREVIDLIRGRNVIEALSVLKGTNKKAAGILVKGLSSALANAKRLPNVNENNLYISCIFADGGPFLKRFKAQTQGRAATIKKRTSHITIELDMKN